MLNSDIDQLTLWSIVMLEKLIILQQFKKFCPFYRAWRFITVFKSPSLVIILRQMNPPDTKQVKGG